MRDADYKAFATMLDDVWGFYSSAKDPSAGQKAMFFRSMACYTLDQVRSGFDGHVKDPQRGRFAPMPADIVAQIDNNAKLDGRPGPEEAWALAMKAADESATFVWTDEMAQAWGVARSIFDRGDEVGARMAFKESYARFVMDARRDARPAVWMPTIGSDPEKRDEALRVAYNAGLLPLPEVLHALPAPDHAMSLSNGRMPDAVRTRLLEYRAALIARAAEPEPERELPRPINLPPLPERSET